MTDASDSQALIGLGWTHVEQFLARAGTERQLIIHWFKTPTDSSVHGDEHWDEPARIEKFLRVVIPTLADQLQAQQLTVAVPWEIEAEQATLVLVAIASGQPAAAQARRIRRTALADAAPYWSLREQVSVPEPLAGIISSLSV